MAYLRTNPTRGLRTFTYLGVSYSIRVFSKSLTPILVVSFIIYSKHPGCRNESFPPYLQSTESLITLIHI